MLIQFLLEEDIKSIDLQSNMAQILASSTATWFIFNVLICFYSERWLVWTSRYYCAQKINNVFYKWALYYCYYHHSRYWNLKKHRLWFQIWLDMIACWWLLFIYSIILMDIRSLTCFSASHWEGKRKKIHAASRPHS